MRSDDVRARLVGLAEKSGESLAELSRRVGRNPAYLQQFVKRGTPRRLDEEARLALAQIFNVDERELGARDPWTPIDDDDRLHARPAPQLL